MKISSREFKHMQKIPKRFTCRGEGISPELIFEKVPQEAKSLVLIMDDPDAPKETFVHWIMYNMPVVDKIKEDSSLGQPGLNSTNQTGYTGPCPPSGEHRYFFKLYALDTVLNIDKPVNKQKLIKTMENHVLQKAEMIGLYSKNSL
jgi:Raf kinase inhibitor-like YbhB/YbcL family protein